MSRSPSPVGTRRSPLAAFALAALAGCGPRLPPEDPPRPALAPAVSPGQDAATAAALARSTFSNAISCPENRIEVEPSSAPGARVPPEVAVDPERLAIWRKNHPEARLPVFDLTGCDRHILLACDAATSLCAPVFDPGRTGGRVRVDPAVTQQGVEHLEQADASGHRPRLGIGFSRVLGLGLAVSAVLPGGPADGKLRVGDVILGADGETVTEDARFLEIIEAHAGRPLQLDVRRDGGRILHVTVDVRAD